MQISHYILGLFIVVSCAETSKDNRGGPTSAAGGDIHLPDGQTPNPGASTSPSAETSPSPTSGSSSTPNPSYPPGMGGFDGDGYSIYSPLTYPVTNLVPLPDGKYIMSTYVTMNGADKFGLYRILSNGQVDTSYGTGGKAIAPAPVSSSYPQSLVLNSDGSVYTVSANFQNNIQSWYVAKFDADGKIVASFGTNGLAKIDMSTTTVVYPFSIGTAANGDVIVGGRGVSPSRAVVAKFNSAGQLISSFGTGGKVEISSGDPRTNAVANQAGEAYVLAGDYGKCSITKLKPDGAVDISFANSGKLIFMYPGQYNLTTCERIALGSDGNLYLAGNWNKNSVTIPVINRFLPNGSADNSFAVNGFLELPMVKGAFHGFYVGSDTIFAANQYIDFDNKNYLTALRIKMNGTLDGQFGTGGRFELIAGSINDSIQALAPAPRGPSGMLWGGTFKGFLGIKEVH